MLIVAMLMGCGPTQADFHERYVEASCERTAACGGQSYDACVASFADAEWPDSETYSPADGADCLNIVEEADCSTEASIAIRDACQGV